MIQLYILLNNVANELEVKVTRPVRPLGASAMPYFNSVIGQKLYIDSSHWLQLALWPKPENEPNCSRVSETSSQELPSR